jgi:DNA polymerase-3 subunit alpha
MDSIAVTDHGVMYGAIEFYQAAKKAGIKPILGVEAYIAPRGRASREGGERYYHMVLLAKNEAGWKNLLKLVSRANLEGYYYKPRMDKEILREHHEGLIALSGCLGGEISQLLLSGQFDKAKETALEYAEIFGEGNFYIEIQKHPHIPDSEKIEADLLRLAKETNLPLVGTQDSHYVLHSDAEYHDVLLAVQTGNKLSDDDRLTLNADDFSIATPAEMVEKFAHLPPEVVSNTQVIADACNVEIKLRQNILPDFPKPEGVSSNEFLRQLIEERLPSRYPAEKLTSEVRERVEYEMGVIEKTGFADYFLIVQDLIMWAKNHGIAVGPGRGSAAGSIVAYILHITDIDPLTYNLLFERFLNPERIQMPDIDIDFSDRRRDEVLAYCRQKYGEDHVAQIITFGTMAARAAVRDAGRAMGLSYGFCDQLAKLIPFNNDIKEALKAEPELKSMYDSNPDAKKLLDVASHLEGVARHASVHACGTVISKLSLSEYLPLQFAPQDKSRIITQFEMHAVEDIGLLKVDFLGLRNLTIIEDCVRLVRDLQGVELNMSAIPLDDGATYELLQEGNTTGVFQFESSGMRRYMKEIRPNVIEDLIALVALYRPGPMELIPLFIDRKHGREKINYLHPKMEPILSNTYGIAVYQEQMMQIARDLAGYSLAEADTLRKAIGKKIKALLDEQEQKMIDGMIKNGIDKKTAQAIWDLYPPFAKYGFNKSHAACYAFIGYQTAYLKAHYPEEYMAALFNNELSDIERVSFLINEAKQNGIAVLPPDINKSGTYFMPENGSLRFGLLAIKNVGEEIARAVIEERTRNGEYKDFSDLLNRVRHKDLNKKSLENFAKGGVFDSLGIERNQILENIEAISQYSTNVKRTAAEAANSLFGGLTKLAPPQLVLKGATAASTQQRLQWEKELLGFFLSDHPLNLWADKIKQHNIPPLEKVAQFQDETRSLNIVGLVSSVKKITTKSGQPMLFATLEDFSPKPLEVIVFTSVYHKTVDVWQPSNVVLVKGRMSWRGGEGKFVCDLAKKLERTEEKTTPAPAAPVAQEA